MTSTQTLKLISSYTLTSTNIYLYTDPDTNLFTYIDVY